jgi:hypothetical protein
MIWPDPLFPSAAPSFISLTGVFEPSAVQQLPDGRFLIVEDEKSRPLSVVTIGSDGEATSTALGPGWFESNDVFWKLDDLEGLTVDRVGRVVAITSHSRDGDGKTKGAREKLVRFRLDGEKVRDTTVVTGLKDALLAAHPELAAAASIRDVKGDGGLNIEALETSADGTQLLLGFRSPLRAGRALLAAIDNPDAMFAGEAPRIARDLVALDLGGQGLRGLAYIAAMSGYLLISGPVARESVHFQLWFWSGSAAQAPQRITVPGLAGFEHAEGVCQARLGGGDCLLIVSDDGSRADGRSARYLLLDFAHLRIG